MSKHLRYTPILLAIAAMTLNACGGIPINVNGKTMMLGGGGEQAPGSLLSPLKTDTAATTVTIQTEGLKPLYTQAGSITGDVLRARESGFKDCGSYTVVLNRPAAKIVVKEEQLMTIRLREQGQNHGMLLMLPGDKYVCKDVSGDALTRKFSPGTYYVYPAWSTTKSKGLNASAGESGDMSVEFEVRTLGRDTPAPEYIVDGNTPNPFKPEDFTYTGGYNQPKDLGFKDCGYSTWITATPIMKVTFTEKRTMTLGLKGKSGLVLVNDDNSYNCGISTKNAMSFEPGTYNFHGFVSKEVAQSGELTTYSPFFYDEKSAPTIKGEVLTQALEPLEAPLLLKVTTQDKRPTDAYGCDKDVAFSAQPDLYLDIKRPIEDLRIHVLEGHHKREGLRIEDITKRELTFSTRRSCEDSSSFNGHLVNTIRNADGRYAVFLGHSGPARTYNLVLTTKGTKIDPYLSISPVPEGLSLAKRAVYTHYPLMERGMGKSIETRKLMWEQTPKTLWAYTSAPISLKAPTNSSRSDLGDPSALELAAGEPVLVRYVTNNRKDGSAFKMSVITADLWTVEVEAEQLTTQAPASLNIPQKPRAYEGIKSYEANQYADAKAIKAANTYKSTRDKYNSCFDKYWDKHGGSSAKHLVRVTRTGSGKVTKVKNLGDEIADRADRACGASKLEPLRKAEEKELVRSFEAMRTAHLKTLSAK